MSAARRAKRLAVVLALSVASAGAGLDSTAAVAEEAPAPPVTIVAAGDIACAPGDTSTPTGCQHVAVADLVSRLAPDQVLALGDLQYADGTLTEFQGSYDLSWGRFKPITKPVVGNHEYQTPGAAGYYDYFGDAAGDRTQGWYSYDVGGWHVVVLNSECAQIGGCGVGSAQEQWLRADLAANPTSCTLASWHRPRWSSATSHPSYSSVGPLFTALYDAGVELVVSGHVHAYERLAPVDPSGRVDVARGVRQFSVGTGGKSLHPFTLPPLPATERRWDSGYGAMQLSLGASGYSWRMVGTDDVVVDSGSAPCHGPGLPVDTTVPLAPAGLAAAVTSPGEVALSWTGGTDETGLVVHRVRRDGVLVGTVGDVETWTDGGAPIGATTTYEVSAVDAAGNESSRARVDVAVPGPPAIAVLEATDDTWVESAAAQATHGADTRLTVDGVPDEDVLLKFPAAPCAPASATLRLTAGPLTGDGSVRGGDVAATSPDWSGSTVSWSTAPVAGPVLASLPPPGPGASVRADVTAGVTTTAANAFRLSSPHSDSARYVSSEDPTGPGPQLLVQCAVPDLSPPTAPTGLTATETAPGAVALAWTAAVDDVGVTGYRVLRDGVQVADVDGTTWTETGLDGARSYTWSVQARDGVGNLSAASTPVTLTTAAVAEVTLAPTADAYVDQSSPTTSYGSASRLAVDDAPRQDVLLRFAVPSTCAVSRADLHLTVGSSGGDGSNHGAFVHAAGAGFTSSVTWETAPAAGTRVATLPAAAIGAALSVDVTSAASAGGAVAFRLLPRGSDGMRFFSTEGTTTSRPRLVVQCAAAGPTPPAPEPTPPDTTAPTVPQWVSAVEELPGTVAVAWQASTDEVGVTAYRVWRDGAFLADATTTSLVDAGRAAGTRYSYTVAARDAAGNWSAASSPAVVTTDVPAPDTTPPPAPTGVTAVETVPGTVTVAWTGSADSSSYAVLRDGVQLGTSALTSWTDVVLPSTTYSYAVVARDAAGNASAPSALATVTTAPAPDTVAPTVPQSVTAVEDSPGAVTLRWLAASDAVGVTAYRVWRDGVLLQDVATTSLVDAGLAAGTRYTYTVAAGDAAGNWSAASSPAVVTTATPPGSERTFLATDDAYVALGKPTARYGTRPVLTVDGTPKLDVLLRFAVDTSGCASPTASLVLHVREGSPSAGSMYAAASSAWSQSTVTWNLAPAAVGPALATLGKVTAKQVVELPLAVAPSGSVTYRFTSTGADGADFAALEAGAATAPRLRVVCS